MECGEGKFAREGFAASPHQIFFPSLRPLVESSSRGAASAAEHCVHEPVSVRSGWEIAIASGQIGCALLDLLSADPPEHIAARFRFASMADRSDAAAMASWSRICIGDVAKAFVLVVREN
jgi:hypothetical protein